MRFAHLLPLLAFALPAEVRAVPVSTSPGPDKVSVTFYRAPGRSGETPMELQWLNGYALITEVRRVSIPAGNSDLRFEGVAGGIIPESAIVTGLPDGVVEKNEDADLLSPASLADRSLGRRVHLRRTSFATGKIREEEAVIRSGAEGALVLQTADGFEALRCTGLNEQLVYDAVPEGLSDKPTLSVRTHSSVAATATVTLSYLAANFDWQANYVARLSPNGKRMDLFSWLTLANGDETSFADADTQAVAGRLNRAYGGSGLAPTPSALELRCWPSATTSDLTPQAVPAPPAPTSDLYFPTAVAGQEAIVVTGTRIARQEELGDLKLYRIPESVTVASHSQKQVAFLDLKNIPIESLYQARIRGDSAEPVKLTLRAVNRKESGLGVPLPAGQVAVFEPGGGRPLLLGESSVEDKAVGEKLEIAVRDAEGVSMEESVERLGHHVERVTLTVTNALPNTVWFEAKISPYGYQQLSGFASGIRRDEGAWIWRVRLRSRAKASTSYRLQNPY